MQRYLESCKTEFWKQVFKAEAGYILNELTGAKDVLSIGCGPAIIERALSEYGFNITGLDISQEALNQAPDSIRTVTGSAEKTNFADSCFDTVIYVASLQFIEEYQKAVKETARILKPGGKLVVMLLNPDSEFFKEKTKNPDSYLNRIRHTNLTHIERVIAEYFCIHTEFFLGIEGRRIFESRDPKLSSLYVIKGKKKEPV